MGARLCSIENCGRPVHGRGWCQSHYNRAYKWGDPLKDMSRKHHLTDHPLYSVWSGLRSRVYTKSDINYERYGARGITVDPLWDRFPPFLEWALASGWQPGLTIDRIDNDGPYAPANCRWATAKEQSNNRRNAHFVTAWGETKAMGEWVDDPRVTQSYDLSRRRIRWGWTPERAMTEPSRAPKPRGGRA